MLLHTKLKDYRLILASQSPRRKQLMREAGFDFTTAENYRVEEICPPELTCADIPIFLSKLKSAAFPRELEADEIVITADTIVTLSDRVLGKPADRDDAIRMLDLLSANTHNVMTGVTLRNWKKSHSFLSATTVFFRYLEREEIEYYVDRYQPYDKAGAYGIQEWIGYAAVERIEGSFYNVMGLPIQKLYTELSYFLK